MTQIEQIDADIKSVKIRWISVIHVP